MALLLDTPDRMDAVVSNYRGGRRTQKTNQMVLIPKDIGDKEQAKKLIGKTVEWTTPSGNKITGKITRAHGGKGHVIARFERGLPGQALGTKAQIQ
jgi:large subunit ribosomal protein L35Ae